MNALGGADTVTVGDLAGTDVTSVETDLAATGGGGDGQPDQVIAEGTAAADNFKVGSAGGRTESWGSPPRLGDRARPRDTLVASGLGGDDQFTADAAVAQPLGVGVRRRRRQRHGDRQRTGGDDTIEIAAAAPARASPPRCSGFVQPCAENLDVNGLGRRHDQRRQRPRDVDAR